LRTTDYKKNLVRLFLKIYITNFQALSSSLSIFTIHLHIIKYSDVLCFHFKLGPCGIKIYKLMHFCEIKASSGTVSLLQYIKRTVALV
jgi:hypothetical protein